MHIYKSYCLHKSLQQRNHTEQKPHIWWRGRRRWWW